MIRFIDPQQSISRATLALFVSMVWSVGVLNAQTPDERAAELTLAVQYDRPSITVIPAGIPSAWTPILARLCEGSCQALPIGGRFDVNELGFSRNFGIPSLASSWDAEKKSLNAEVADAVLSAVANGGAARSTLLHLYSAEQDFVWSTDRLVSRALYGVTVSDAIQTIASERGVTGANASTLVTNSYILAFGFTGGQMSVESSTVENPLTGTQYTQYQASSDAQPFAVLLKLDFATRQDVLATLEPYFCGSTPSDCGNPADLNAERQARSAAFQSFQPPVRLVAVLEPSEVSVIQLNADRAQAVAAAEAALLAAIFDAIIDEAVRAEPLLRVRTPVVATGPISANIGLKEGVKRGRRYVAFRRTEDLNGDLLLDRRGFVRATRATDNRQTVVEVDESGRQAMAEIAPSSFQQTFGRGISRFDILEERPDYGIGVAVGGAYEGGAGLWGRVDYRLLSIPGISFDFLPLGSMAFVEGVYVLSPSAPSSSGQPELRELVEGGSYTRISFGLGSEFYLLRGNLRVGGEASYGLVSLDASAAIAGFPLPGLKLSADHLRVGAKGGFAITQDVELVGRLYFGRAGSTKITDGDGNAITLFNLGDWSDLTNTGNGVGMTVGLRYAF